MNDDEFAKWCEFFHQMLLKPGEDGSYLVEWRKFLEPYTLAECREAVMYCVATIVKWDKAPKYLLSKILVFLREKRRPGERKRFDFSDQVESGDAWVRSPQRKKAAERSWTGVAKGKS